MRLEWVGQAWLHPDAGPVGLKKQKENAGASGRETLKPFRGGWHVTTSGRVSSVSITTASSVRASEILVDLNNVLRHGHAMHSDSKYS